ncbi:MAG: shikimate kinase [Bacteroidetes bacterium]|jgi:shikimate kinase|nr:shikimate kinase [Bacteroidota bacterium]
MIDRNIFLVGFMGSGKTTYGKKLAGKLGIPFTDLDEWIETQSGKPIPSWFDEMGEEAFRKYESDALRQAAREPGVIATGGGTPCQDGNMDWMLAQGYTVYLKLFEGQLVERLGKAKADRPMLRLAEGEGLRGRVHALLQERSQFYARAHLVLHPEFFTPERLAAQLTIDN